MIPEPDATAEMAAVRELGAYVLAHPPEVLRLDADPQAFTLNEAVRAAILEGQRRYAVNVITRLWKGVCPAGAGCANDTCRVIASAIAELEAKEETMSDRTAR